MRTLATFTNIDKAGQYHSSASIVLAKDSSDTRVKGCPTEKALLFLLEVRKPGPRGSQERQLNIGRR
jgi:hypothetical protein